jgi:pimeloyl-ACP methyl ester carboxylesterase
VLLISGSGGQDRDESILGHKPFLILADYLTRRGIAVLRVDDRGVGGTSGDASKATTADFTDDVLAGVAYLKSRKDIDPRRIGLIGHSEGALIAPLAATRSPDVAFIVLLAAAGVPGDEIIMRQGELIARAQKADEAKIAESQKLQRQLLEILKNEPDAEKAKARLREAFANSSALAAAGTPAAREALEKQIAAQVDVMLTPWFRYYVAYDPAPTLRKVRCPVLALNGDKDLQVDSKQNIPPITQALAASNNGDSTIMELQGLNHLFQHCTTGSPVEYGRISETFAPKALDLIGNWIVSRTQ